MTSGTGQQAKSGYNSPRLVKLGGLAQLTGTGTGSNPENGVGGDEFKKMCTSPYCPPGSPPAAKKP
jgi:hypothetical protein